MKDIKFNEPIKYKVICDMLNDEEKPSGRNRNLQLARWRKQYIIDKNKTWYTIIRPLNEAELEIVNNNSNTKFQKFLDIHVYDKDINKIKDNGGVYKIYYNNYIYIGQTNNFRRRIYNHKKDNSKAYQLLLKGGMFEIVKIESDKDLRLSLEKCLIEYYSNNKNYKCVNDDYNENRDFVNRTRVPRYKKVKFNYNEWEYIKEILDREGVTYYYDK